MARTPISPTPPPQLLTVLEAASALHVDKTTLYDLLRAGELTSLHIGRSRRISVNELQRFIHTREHPNDDQPSPNLRAARKRAKSGGRP